MTNTYQNGIFEQVLADNSDKLDIFVANAGIWTCGDFEQITEEEFDRVVGINMKGAFFALQAALPPLRASGGCAVVMGSDQCFVGKVEQNLYGMTKGALGQLVKSLAAQYAPLGVRINAVCPGTIDTPLMHNAVAKISAEKGIDSKGIYERINTAQPMPRVGQPEEVAQLVLAVCCNGFMAGALVSIDGGYTCV
uniref:Uncharacterized protein n=1 Tax=Chrysotila carterae TaxID=13221 RepID=A0A7S4ETK2_CHRCT